MTTNKVAEFSTLLAYSEVSGHKLSVPHAAKAAGIALRTAYTKVANARKILDAKAGESNAQTTTGVAAFGLLLRYSELSGHKLSAQHAATATNIALRTAYTKIAEAKQAAGGVTEASEGAMPPPKSPAGGRKRKASAKDPENDTAESVEKQPPKKKTKHTPKSEIKVEEADAVEQMEMKVEEADAVEQVA